MGKLTMLAAGAAGYVFGARAGRERYDQISATAGKVWRDPRVQERKDQAADKAKQAANQAGDKAQQATGSAKEAAGSAKSSAKEKAEEKKSSQSSQSSQSGGDVDLSDLDIPSTNAVPDSGVTPGDVAPPAFPADPGQPGESTTR